MTTDNYISDITRLLEEEDGANCQAITSDIIERITQNLKMDAITNLENLQEIIQGVESYDWQVIEDRYCALNTICSPEDILNAYRFYALFELEDPSVKNQINYNVFFNISRIQYFRAVASIENDPEILRCFIRLINAGEYLLKRNETEEDFFEESNRIVKELSFNKSAALIEILRVYMEDLLSMTNNEHEFYSIDVDFGLYLHRILTRIYTQIYSQAFPEENNETTLQVASTKELTHELGASLPASQDPNTIFEKMDRIIGLETVKTFIRSLYSFLTVQKKRKELGLATQSTQTVHMIFKGNPGTGKTTFARIVAEVLHSVGYLPQVKLTEVDRSKLVAGYVGQTTIQTREAVQNALDGVLFIDEAYALASDADSKGGFGKEAIDTLVKEIDDNRDRIVVILAGYSREMDDFLQTNPGLKSRFPNVIEFPDYNSDELQEIASRMYIESDYELTELAISKMRDIFDEVRHDSQFGNGRYVRNLYEKSLRLQSQRLVNETNFSRETFMMIDVNDIEKV